jgi:hypothetical protein
MSYRVLSIDPLNSGKPEDAFGLSDAGNLVVAIRTHCLVDGEKALIFTFVGNSISVSYDKIYICAGYQINDFNEILAITDDPHNQKILNKVYDCYVKLSHKSVKNNNMASQGIHPILRNILSKVYKHVGRYFGANSVNLKREKYSELLQIVEQEKQKLILI